MPQQNNRREYDSRMHRVVEHIDKHLDRAIDLDELASVANFSPFHFHRLFSAWMGETLGGYVQRRRAEVAAMRLIAQPRLNILDTALSVGFGSAEAFSRAFRKRFDSSPTAWRRQQAQQRGSNRKSGQMNSKIDQMAAKFPSDHGGTHEPRTEFAMKVQLIDRQPVHVAYLRYVGPYGPAVSEFLRNTYYEWAATNDLLARPRYGISHDDPGITAPEKCRYDACVEVPANFSGTGNFFKTTIAGGRYASMPFYGTAAEAPAAWAGLLRDWLPTTGLQLDARPAFEYYPPGARFDPQTGAFECHMCIPVAPV